jgi:hypothetical protein
VRLDAGVSTLEAAQEVLERRIVTVILRADRRRNVDGNVID